MLYPHLHLSMALNEPLLADLRDNEEYNPYKHAITFNQFQMEDFRNPTEKFLYMFAGPYTPLSRTIIRALKLTERSITSAKQETRDRALEELTNRMSVEALGNLGLIPFYKDIRRMIIKERFGKRPPTAEQLKKWEEEYLKRVPPDLRRSESERSVPADLQRSGAERSVPADLQ